MQEELFFEVLRKKSHIFLQAKADSNGHELKRMLEAILKVPTNEQTLKKPNEFRTEWTVIDDSKSLNDSGFNKSNARAEEPAVIALLLQDDNNIPQIDPLTEPPPLPPAMQHQGHLNENMETDH